MENKSKVKGIIREHIDSLKGESLEVLTEEEKEYVDNVKVENNSNDLFDDIDEEFAENNVDNDLGDGIQEEVTGEMNIDEEEITKTVNPDDELRLTLLGIVSDLAYPIDYPGVDELMKLKKDNGELFIMEFGSFIDKVSLNTNPMVMIITHAKPKMFDEFKELYPDESYNSAKFSNFLIERCVLHPKMSSEDVNNMPGGSYFYLLSQIRSKSYLNAEVSITKI